MVRNALTHAFVVGIVCIAAESLALAQEKVRDDVASQVSTLSLGQLVLRDTFNDNKMASMWRLWADDVNNCRVVEVNNRLEVQAKSEASHAFSGYIAYGWRLDPNDDFQMKVGFHVDLKKMDRCWVSLGITPNGKKPRDQRINIDAQAGQLLKSFMYERQDNGGSDSSYGQRFTDDGTIYLSYSAKDDTVYLSMSGYGADNAWGAFPGVLQGAWGGKPLYVWIGGGSDGLEVTSGHVYLDNLEVETGTVVESSLQPVYHFKTTVSQQNFYTMSATEKEKLLKHPSMGWVYDGPVFYAFPDDTDPDSKPVYRFYARKTQSHFFTLSEAERDQHLALSDWIYEGIAFYAYPAGQQTDWACPVYRVWSPIFNSYCYTPDETVKNALLKATTGSWSYQGIAWYAVR
jgi:hypothetical protein